MPEDSWVPDPTRQQLAEEQQWDRVKQALEQHQERGLALAMLAEAFYARLEQFTREDGTQVFNHGELMDLTIAVMGR